MRAEMVFTIVDGRITRLAPLLPSEEFQAVWDSFASWLEENVPGATGQLAHMGGSDTPQLDAETVAVWQEYAPLFLASLDEDIAGP
jgi:hypothetical protein